MAVDANALTLAEYATLSNDPLVREVIFTLLDAGTALDDIPFRSMNTLVVNGVRWDGNLPTVDWVPLNTEGAVTKGQGSPYQEQAYIIRNRIQVDKFLVQDKNQIVDPRGVQVSAYMRARAYDFNYMFINNNHLAGGEVNAILGLRYRLDNPGTFGLKSSCKVDAAAVDMRTANMTAATLAAFHQSLDQMLWEIDAPNGTGSVLYMNEVMKRRWELGLRLFSGQGGLSQAQDQFGRTMDMYKNAQVRDIGYKGDQSTRIIATTETAAGLDNTGADVHTSIYGVNYSADHTLGWQFGPMDVIDQGLTEGGAVYQTAIDWAGGIITAHPRSIGRTFGIKLA